MAYGGYGPSHYLELWKEGMALKPKLVIAAFYAGNDLYDSFRMVYDKKYKGRLKRSDNPQVLERIKEASIRMSIEGEATSRRDDPAAKFQFLQQNSLSSGQRAIARCVEKLIRQNLSAGTL